MHKGFFDELYCAKTNVPDEFRAYRTFPPDAGPTFTGEEEKTSAPQQEIEWKTSRRFEGQTLGERLCELS